VRRREFIKVIAGSAASALPLTIHAHAMPVIGYLSARSPEDTGHLVEAFRRGLSEAGFVEGQKDTIEHPEFGQKLVRAKGPLEFAQCQNEFMARQAQTIADQTREFSQKLQQAAQTFASDASSAMAETSRKSEETVSNIASRAEQTTRRQRS
jgi:hypothetical protein